MTHLCKCGAAFVRTWRNHKYCGTTCPARPTTARSPRILCKCGAAITGGRRRKYCTPTCSARPVKARPAQPPCKCGAAITGGRLRTWCSRSCNDAHVRAASRKAAGKCRCGKPVPLSRRKWCSRRCKDWHQSAPNRCATCAKPCNGTRCITCHDSDRSPMPETTKANMRAAAKARFEARYTVTPAAIETILDLRLQLKTHQEIAPVVGLSPYMVRQLWVKHRRSA